MNETYSDKDTWTLDSAKKSFFGFWESVHVLKVKTPVKQDIDPS